MPATVPALLARTVARVPDLPALVDGEVRLTWSELGHRVDLVARSLIALGVERGDRVMLLGPNDHRWIEASLGALSVGAVVVPVNTRYSGFEVLDLVERTRAKVLLTVASFVGHAYLSDIRAAALAEHGAPGKEDRGPVPGVSGLVAVVEWDAHPESGRDAHEQVLDWERFLALADGVPASTAARRSTEVSGDDPADIVFTSGTTGRSKGAVSLQSHTVGCALAWAENVRVTDADNYLIVSPFAHTFGYKAGLLVCVATGATMLPMATFDTARALRVVRDQRVTVLPGPPTIFQMILDHPDRPAPAEWAWRVAVTGAATVPMRLVERMHEELGLEAVVTGYGLSEAVTVTMTAYDDPPARVVSSAGRPIAEFELRIRDEQGRVLAAGQSGEVEVRGPHVMVGYLDDPEATAAAIDDEGWLRTGDIGLVSADGYLTITDRIKDMFTVGGFNVYPAELEHVLSRLPGVAESCVIGVPDERLGSVGKVFVIRTADSGLTAEEVTRFLSGRVANFKVPRRVEFVDDLPRNHGGKVLKRLLIEAESSGSVPG